MSIAEILLLEFDHEMTTTRNLLQIVPFAEKDFKPHPKSMSLLDLATHVAKIPLWTLPTIGQDSLDLGPNGEGAKFASPPMGSTEDLLKYFDENVKRARQALTTAPDELFQRMWTLKIGEHIVFSLPKAGVMRSFVMNHLIHHRGQLSVYLRIKDVKLPSIYGPTADTQVG